MTKTIAIWITSLSLMFTNSSLISQTLFSAKGTPYSSFFEYTFEPGEYSEEPDEQLHLNAYQYLEYDATGLWQIGQPQKAEWDSAYKGNYVLMTDTLNMLTQPTRSSFTFKFERPWISNCIAGWDIYMPNMYDLPVNKAGVYVEVSYNHGENWLQIIEDTLPCFYFENEGLICFKPYVFDYFYEYRLENYYVASGEKKSWGGDYLLLGKDFGTDSVAGSINSVWLKFTYNNTDTVSHKGWMIDNLQIFIHHYCEFLSVNETDTPLANLYPNPVLGQSTLSFENSSKHEWQLNVYNLMGKLVMSEQTCNEYFLINKARLATGSYVYQLITNNKNMASGKFVVQ